MKMAGRATVTPGTESGRFLVQPSSSLGEAQSDSGQAAEHRHRVSQSAGKPRLPNLPKQVEGWTKVPRLEDHGDNEEAGRDYLLTDRSARLFSVRKTRHPEVRRSHGSGSSPDATSALKDGSQTERARTSHAEASRSKYMLAKREQRGRARIQTSSSSLRPWTPEGRHLLR